MTDPQAEHDYISARLLFEQERCRCCDCCEGYCPDQEDRTDRWPTLYTITVHGREYITDRFILIARDALGGLPEEQIEPMYGTPKTDWAVVPDEQPEPSRRPQSAGLLDRLIKAGVTAHEGERAVNLYRNGAHVGWALWAKRNGITLADLPLVREIAGGVGLDLNAAAMALTIVREQQPAPLLHRDWGTASDVRDDGFVNPSSVNYAPSEASAIKKAGIRGEVAVTRLSADWEMVLPPASTPTDDNEGGVR